MNRKLLRAALLGFCFSVAMAVSAGASYESVGIVTGDVVNLRAQPNTNCAVLTKVTRDEVVLVVEKASEDWYKVDYCTIEGYISADWLEVSDDYSSPLCYGRVDTNGSSLNMRSAPGTRSSKVASIPSNTVVAVDGMKDGWFKVKYNGKTGYVSGEYILAVSKENTRRDDPVETKTPAAEITSAPSAETSDLAEQIVAYAKEFLGVPYAYGANGPNSFDCSAFTKYVFKNFGYSLTRSAASQLSDGVGVKMEDIQVGDIICWRQYGSSKAATHVGIYIGNGEYIHASSSGSVRINEMSYGSSVRYVVGVRRII